jgi:imidazolonepropionase-like amidohydrolase
MFLTRALMVSLAVLCGWGSASAQLAVIPQDFVAFTNANVLDVRGGRLIAGATVVVRDGKIVSVGNEGVPAGAKVIDLRGRTLMPGLIDAHTHLSSLPAANVALRSGVTTIRTAGVSFFQDVAMRELSKKGAIPGPDVVASGIFISKLLADTDLLADPSLADITPGLPRAEYLRRMVRMNIAHGVDIIKTRSTERAGLPNTDPREQVFSEDDLRIVVEEAAKKGLGVECHSHGEEGSLAAVRAGVKSIEHGTYLSDETLALMKEKGTYLVPTYTIVFDLAEPGGDYDNPLLIVRGRSMMPHIQHAIRQAYKLGVKIAASTDTSYEGASVARVSHEVVHFADLGMTPIDAIRTATMVAAELLGLSTSTGVVEPGFEADLLAVNGNPIENIRVLEDAVLVVSNGRIAVNRLDFGMPSR